MFVLFRLGRDSSGLSGLYLKDGRIISESDAICRYSHGELRRSGREQRLLLEYQKVVSEDEYSLSWTMLDMRGLRCSSVPCCTAGREQNARANRTILWGYLYSYSNRFFALVSRSKQCFAKYLPAIIARVPSLIASTIIIPSLVISPVVVVVGESAPVIVKPPVIPVTLSWRWTPIVALKGSLTIHSGPLFAPLVERTLRRLVPFLATVARRCTRRRWARTSFGTR